MVVLCFRDLQNDKKLRGNSFLSRMANKKFLKQYRRDMQNIIMKTNRMIILW